MLRKVFVTIALCVSTVISSGCVYVVVGGVGALGGYVISPDAVEGTIENYEYDKIWDAAVDTVSDRGIIDEKNDAGGIVIATIQGAKVTATVFRQTPETVKITVKARRSFFPKIKIAQEIYSEIINKVAK